MGGNGSKGRAAETVAVNSSVLRFVAACKTMCKEAAGIPEQFLILRVRSLLLHMGLERYCASPPAVTPWTLSNFSDSSAGKLGRPGALWKVESFIHVTPERMSWLNRGSMPKTCLRMLG